MDEVLKQILDEMRLMRTDVTGLKSDVSQIKSQLNQFQADAKTRFDKLETELELVKQSQARTQQDIKLLQKGLSEMAVLQDYVIKEAGRHDADIHLLRHEVDVVRTQIDPDGD